MGGYLEYPEYKDSGVEWLGKVPAHWDVKRLKDIASCNDEALNENTDPDYEIEYVDISSVNLVEGITHYETIPFEKAPSRARRKVRDGDTVISTVRTYLKAIAAVRNPPENMIVSTGFAVIRPKAALESDYIGYLLQSEGFIGDVVANSVGVSYPAINSSVLTCLPVIEPPLSEQQSIARFLDYKTVQIDALIAKKETLLAKFAEKRTALISQAVTKGLDPTVPMKDSGIEWLGKVPAHWDVKRLKDIASCNDEALNENTDPGYEIEYVDISSVNLVKGITHYETMPFEKAPSRARRKVRDGDTVISTVRTYLKAIAAVRNPPENMIVSTGFAVIRPKAALESDYIGYLLQSEGFIGDVVANSVGVSYPAINSSVLTCLPVVEPPLLEQQSIARFLDYKTAQIDALIAKVNFAIDRLKEYRTALITNAVTGKIDVRDVKLPEANWLAAS